MTSIHVGHIERCRITRDRWLLLVRTGNSSVLSGRVFKEWILTTLWYASEQTVTPQEYGLTVRYLQRYKIHIRNMDVRVCAHHAGVVS